MADPFSPRPYPIGTPGTPWGVAERNAWLARQQVQRSYFAEVIAPLKAHRPSQAELFEYGVLDLAPMGLGRYPLFAVRSRVWNPELPAVLITGGVHGYETSGVQGALQWLESDFDRYSGRINLLVLPCISPWGYETINRWNPDALDPNRHFKAASPAAVKAMLIAAAGLIARPVVALFGHRDDVVISGIRRSIHRRAALGSAIWTKR